MLGQLGQNFLIRLCSKSHCIRLVAFSVCSGGQQFRTDQLLVASTPFATDDFFYNERRRSTPSAFLPEHYAVTLRGLYGWYEHRRAGGRVVTAEEWIRERIEAARLCLSKQVRVDVAQVSAELPST